MKNTFLLLFASAISSTAIADSSLQLNSGTAEISGGDHIKLYNLRAFEQFYDAEIAIRLDGGYDIISAAKSTAEATAMYTITVNATWNESSHPYMFPSGSDHFSGLVGATHNSSVTFWENGQLASPGIESMAETGSKSSLLSEVRQAQDDGYADQQISGGGIGDSPGSVSVELEIDRNYPFLTLVSMIAPSPDWFIGVNGLNLMPKGQWLEEVDIPLFAYDAGTDDGEQYTSANTDSNPQQAISRLQTKPFVIDEEIRPIAVLSIRRQRP